MDVYDARGRLLDEPEDDTWEWERLITIHHAARAVLEAWESGASLTRVMDDLAVAIRGEGARE